MDPKKRGNIFTFFGERKLPLPVDGALPVDGGGRKAGAGPRVLRQDSMAYLASRGAARPRRYSYGRTAQSRRGERYRGQPKRAAEESATHETWFRWLGGWGGWGHSQTKQRRPAAKQHRSGSPTKLLLWHVSKAGGGGTIKSLQLNPWFLNWAPKGGKKRGLFF